MRLTRRGFLGFGTLGTTGVLLGTGAWDATPTWAASLPHDPFTLGVGSGDPRPDGVVLWTRLAPAPLAIDGRGGMPNRPVRVLWQVATDERFRRVVRAGSVVATPQLGHSVHPEVGGLSPDRVYWYRFRAGGYLSPVGRTRTTPPDHARPSSLALAYASCQAWQDGFFTAYDHLADDDLDLVVHLGDYVYESPLLPGNRRGETPPPGFETEMTDLAGYRLRYALYRSESPLQRASGAHPWVHTFDDHEVENNWAGDLSQTDDEPDQDPAVFRQRRAQAYQAMYEHQPLRRAQLPAGPDIRIHRRIPYGRLADLTMLDTRSHRDDQPCGDGQGSDCDERFEAGRTMLGGDQRRWLADGLKRSTARWQIIGNQAPVGQTDLDPDPDVTEVFYDPWDGYVAERNRLLRTVHELGVQNLVVITGDRHQNYAGDLVTDFADPQSPVVGTEFVGTSITTGGDGADLDDQGRAILAANPHLHFVNQQRGYCRAVVTRDQWRQDFRVVPYVQQPGAPVATRASFVVESGRPGVVSA